MDARDKPGHDGGEKLVAFPLTFVTISVTLSPNLAHVRDVFRMRSELRSECGARGRSRKLPPGGFGHHAAGNQWPAVGATGLGQAGVGNARLAELPAVNARARDPFEIPAFVIRMPRPRKPGIAVRRTASLRLPMSWTEMFRHLQEEPRWNADRRACSAEHAAASEMMRTVGYASVGVPLPFLSVPSSSRCMFFQFQVLSVPGSCTSQPGRAQRNRQRHRDFLETFRPFGDFTWLNPGDRSLAHAPRA